MTDPIPDADRAGMFLGRVWLPEAAGPAVVTLRDGALVDITSRAAPTVRDICEMDDPAGHVATAPGRPLGPLAGIAAHRPGDPGRIQRGDIIQLPPLKEFPRDAGNRAG